MHLKRLISAFSCRSCISCLKFVPHTEGHHKCHDLSYQRTRLLEAHLCIPQTAQDEQKQDAQKLYNICVNEIGMQLATEEEGVPFGIGVTLATLQQTANRKDFFFDDKSSPEEFVIKK